MLINASVHTTMLYFINAGDFTSTNITYESIRDVAVKPSLLLDNIKI